MAYVSMIVILCWDLNLIEILLFLYLEILSEIWHATFSLVLHNWESIFDFVKFYILFTQIDILVQYEIVREFFEIFGNWTELSSHITLLILDPPQH